MNYKEKTQIYWLSAIFVLSQSYALPESLSDWASKWNLGTFIANLNTFWLSLGKLTLFCTVLVGVYFLMIGFTQLIKVSQGRLEAKTPFLSISAGVFLLSFIYIVNAGEYTFFADTPEADISSLQVFAKYKNNNANAFKATFDSIVHLLKLAGLIFMFKGFLVLKAMGNNNSQAGIGKVLAHFVPGLFLFHLEKTTTLVMNTLQGSGS